MSQEVATPGSSSRRAGGVPGADRPDPNLAILLREPFLAFIAELLRRLHDAGYDDLRIAHLVVFQHIDPEGSRVTDLAAKAQMAKPSMSYLVEHLEEAGYLERHPDPTDGRARLVRLTARGWQEVADALDIIAGMEAELATALQPERMATLRSLLTALGTITAPWRTGEGPT
ncbi:MAG: MarR family winged helix-turn-helix transcriptional regulator [Actinomycetota bacterium]|nr:MarR family winged helix-turn-helix transcriptional regulator [Actinomycetota bacterium]